MDIYLRLVAGILIAAILTMVLKKQEKDIAFLLCLTVCAVVVISISVYLEEMVSLVWQLSESSGVEESWIRMILKILGIGLLSQISASICSDSGNQSLSQVIQILTNVVILWLCMPLLEQILNLLRTVLEEL